MREGVVQIQEMMLAARTASIKFPAPFWRGPAGWTCPALSQDPTPLPSAEFMEGLAKQVHALSQAICGAGAVLASGTLSRRLLNIVERHFGEAVWDECRMAVLSEILPDIAHNMASMSAMRAGDFRRRFGMSPLVVSASEGGCATPCSS